MKVRDAGEVDLSGLLAIYNDAVLTTTAIWNDAEVDLDNRRGWLGERRQRGYPVLVAVEDDAVLGYASFADWRAWDGYRHTVEHSVYVGLDHRGRGVGGALMLPLIDRARDLGKHVLVGAIEGMNEPSLRLHRRLGFRQVGHLEEVGTKFGRWLDLVLMQLTLVPGRSGSIPEPMSVARGR
jgi:L-amino acid N-acyltransferase